MTIQEWTRLAYFMEHAWNTPEWTDDKTAVYYEFLKNHEAGMVLKAIHYLQQEGKPFRPSSAQIVNAINKMSDAELPSWSVVFGSIDKALAMRRVQGLCFLRAIHPIVRAFVEWEGWEALQVSQWYGDYGELERERLRVRWEAFSDNAKDRVMHGRSIHSMTGGHCDVPHQLDMVEALGLEVPKTQPLLTEGTAA
jgi:hypothetical protein